MQGFADLHTHTHASDGTEPPESNVRLAAEAGLAAVAITDHDTVAGVAAAVREGEKLGIRVVPGVEISTWAGGQDIHVLGYFIDPEDTEFGRRLESQRRVRETRNEMLIMKLQELGMHITMQDVIDNMERKPLPGESVGRPHISDLLVKKGYAASMKDAFDRYLGRDGAAYVSPPRIEPQEAVRWIREAGGSAVLAHPGLYQDDALVEEIIRGGIDGIEAYHSDHSAEDVRRYLALAESWRLPVTAGSDYHGVRNGVVFHAPLGSQKISVDVLEILKERVSHDKNT